MIRSLILFLAASLMAGCADPLSDGGGSGLVETLAEAPPGAAPGTCWGKLVTPAVIETVTDQVMVRPARLHEDGSVAAPAVYETKTRQAIVQERAVTWFETPCAADTTPEFVSSVQRALRARGLYRGAITGQMDTRTRAAVRRFQAGDGLDSGILSLAAARRLGLIAVEIPQAEE